MAFEGIAIRWHMFGLQRLQKSLLGLPYAVRNRIARKALEFAATPVVNLAKKLASPRGRRNKRLDSLFAQTGVRQFGSGGTIKKSIVRKSDMNGDSPVVKVGVLKRAFWANMIHSGSRPHAIPMTRGPLAGRVISHPGHKANPFLDRALAATKHVVLSRLKQKITEGLSKYAATQAAKGGRR